MTIINIGEICQNITIETDINWIDCEFTNCNLRGLGLITQDVLDNNKSFKNCIETNELHTDKDKLPIYILKRLNQRDKSEIGTDLT